jgi:hypothetical protein
MIQLGGKNYTTFSLNLVYQWKLVRLIKMCFNETYSKVHISRHLYDAFLIQNGLEQRDALSPLLSTLVYNTASGRSKKTKMN